MKLFSILSIHASEELELDVVCLNLHFEYSISLNMVSELRKKERCQSAPLEHLGISDVLTDISPFSNQFEKRIVD